MCRYLEPDNFFLIVDVNLLLSDEWKRKFAETYAQVRSSLVDDTTVQLKDEESNSLHRACRSLLNCVMSVAIRLGCRDYIFCTYMFVTSFVLEKLIGWKLRTTVERFDALIS